MRNLFFILCLFLESFHLISQTKTDSTLIRLENQFKSSKTDSLKVEALIDLANYQKKRDFNKVISYCNKALEITNNAIYDSRYQKVKIYSNSGVYKRRKSNYVGALKDYFFAENLAFKINDSTQLASLYHNIAMVYRSQQEYHKSIQFFNKAISINLQKNKYRSLGHNYSMMSGSYKNLRLLDSSYYVINKAITYFEKDNYEEGKQQAYANKGSIHTLKKDYKKALVIYHKNLEYVKGINKKRSIITTNINLANLYLLTKDYTKALNYVNDGIALAISENSNKQLYNGYLIRSRIYKAMRKHNLAFDDVIKYSAINEKINSVKKARELREIEVLNLQEKQRIKDSILRHEETKNLSIKIKNERLKKQLYGSIIFIFALLIIIILYYGYQQYINTKEKHLLKETQLSTKIEDLNTEFSSKEEEIIDLRTETLHHLETKGKLTQNLSKISKTGDEYSLNKIIAELKKEAIDEEKIKFLKENIKTLNKDFLDRLKKTHPKLTKTDIEVCSFIKVGLSRREISNIRKTSLEAIKSTRFRLKKKLELSKDQKLDEYIQSI